MSRITVFVCDKCRRPSGFERGVKTTKCRNCQKSHSTGKIYRKFKVWHAKDAIGARKIMQALKTPSQ